MPAVRAVLDTNIFVSAFLGKGPPARIYEAFKKGEFELISSKELVAEAAEVLMRPALGIPPEDIKPAFRLLRKRALIIRPKDRIDVCRDPSDDLVLECAVSGKADWIVTGDQDLLSLHPYRGISIVSPKEFLKQLPNK